MINGASPNTNAGFTPNGAANAGIGAHNNNNDDDGDVDRKIKINDDVDVDGQTDVSIKESFSKRILSRLSGYFLAFFFSSSCSSSSSFAPTPDFAPQTEMLFRRYFHAQRRQQSES